MAGIHFQNVGKTFPGGSVAVRDFNLEVADGEFVVLVGPSGCGKSTLLRLLAGLEEMTSGEIRIGDRSVNGLPPQQRNVAMVFQNYALYPHMSVRQNLAFPLKMAGWAADRIEARVAEKAKLLELEPLLERRPGQLSGGQRQRVAMGRALVREPAVFLMDEPLSNLDAQLRVQLRREITALQRRLRTTTLYVTHDQVEAMTMGDRLAVLNHGELQQAGTPEELYARPANLFVATFLGSPRMNLCECPLRDGSKIDFAGHLIPLPEFVAQGGSQQGTIIVGLRPEAISPRANGGPGTPIEARVTGVETMGHEQIVYLDAGVAPFSSRDEVTGAGETFGEGQAWAARLPAAVRVASGEKIPLQFDFNQAHFFDQAGCRLGQAN